MDNQNVFFDVLTPVHFISRSAMIYPHKTAIVYDDKRYTYKEFYARVNRLASALQKGRHRQRRQGGLSLSEHPAHAGGTLCRADDRRGPGQYQYPSGISGEIGYIINHSDCQGGLCRQ